MRGEQTWKLDEAEQDKVRMTTNHEVGGESIWVVKHGNEMALRNHALAFYPFPSWGAVFPYQREIDVTDVRGKKPSDTVLTLHPEAWDKLVEAGAIDAEGNFILPEEIPEEDQDSSVETED